MGCPGRGLVRYVEVAVSIHRGLLDGGFDIVPGDIEKLSGRLPRTLHEALAAALWHVALSLLSQDRSSGSGGRRRGSRQLIAVPFEVIGTTLNPGPVRRRPVERITFKPQGS